ncbi:hypothetical protein L596_007085 [Steinernema carpocapsae]|uniref:Uncharacterized protein n=1 Tax=Steinernema carpocapsae TaxID=34508 RepID=A0A4U5P862_STECR|nr:hypothetical protein L596_007085 [Steinernema carpocapsae]
MFPVNKESSGKFNGFVFTLWGLADALGIRKGLEWITMIGLRLLVKELVARLKINGHKNEAEGWVEGTQTIIQNWHSRSFEAFIPRSLMLMWEPPRTTWESKYSL